MLHQSQFTHHPQGMHPCHSSKLPIPRADIYPMPRGSDNDASPCRPPPSKPQLPLLLSIISRENSPTVSVFFLKKGKYTEKTLKTGQRRRSYLCAHAVLQSYLKASCVCSFFSGGLGVVEVEDGFAVRAGAKLNPGRARRQLTSSVVSIHQQTAVQARKRRVA